MWHTRLTELYGLEVPFVSAGMGFVAMSELVSEERCLAAGENVTLVKEIKPAGEIVHEMMEEARRIIGERLSAMLDRYGH